MSGRGTGLPAWHRRRLHPAAAGVSCPQCGTGQTQVYDTRQHGLGIRRRRACLRCNARFTTLETAMQDCREEGKSLEILGIAPRDIQALRKASEVMSRVFSETEEQQEGEA